MILYNLLRKKIWAYKHFKLIFHITIRGMPWLFAPLASQLFSFLFRSVMTAAAALCPCLPTQRENVQVRNRRSIRNWLVDEIRSTVACVLRCRIWMCELRTEGTSAFLPRRSDPSDGGDRETIVTVTVKRCRWLPSLVRLCSVISGMGWIKSFTSDLRI
jgi:hypothetical protein